MAFNYIHESSIPTPPIIILVERTNAENARGWFTVKPLWLAKLQSVEGELAGCLHCRACEGMMDAFTCIGGGIVSGIPGHGLPQRMKFLTDRAGGRVSHFS